MLLKLHRLPDCVSEPMLLNGSRGRVGRARRLRLLRPAGLLSFHLLPTPPSPRLHLRTHHPARCSWRCAVIGPWARCGARPHVAHRSDPFV